MGDRIHALAQQLFGKASVEECTFQEVETLAKKYPYFAPAQFLFLQKLKQEGSPEYQSQLQKAVLFYHNPLEFEYFINSERFYSDERELTQTQHLSEEPETSITKEASENLLDVTPDAPAEEEMTVETPAVDEDKNAEYSSLHSEQQEEEKETDVSISESEGPAEINAGATQELELPSMSAEVQGELQTSNDAETRSLKSLAAENLPQPEHQNDVLFEPYHTVDYFASQGIKPVQEDAPKDSFSKQLKSFTEWLKTMKRLPAAQSGAADPAAESKVLGMANDSVHDPNVATEAMAEVWLKQGNTEKAIEIYNKLSLLNPSKKAFFAAKIENLKHS